MLLQSNNRQIEMRADLCRCLALVKHSQSALHQRERLAPDHFHVSPPAPSSRSLHHIQSGATEPDPKNWRVSSAPFGRSTFSGEQSDREGIFRNFKIDFAVRDDPRLIYVHAKADFRSADVRARFPVGYFAAK